MMPAAPGVPHSSGTARPATAAPAGACDAHIHIYDHRFPVAVPGAMLDNATAGDYRLLQARLGTERTVVVQPRAHGTDNSVTLAAIQALGRQQTRGVAVVSPDIADSELRQLHDGGIRGLRFSLHSPVHAASDIGQVEPLARRIHTLGWHVQLHWTAAQIVEHEALLKRLPCPIVFDHLARLPLPLPGQQAHAAHPAHAIVQRLLDQGNTWVKLSGAYLNSALGASGGYADTVPLAQAWVRHAPERLVWGSDWPHPTEPHQKPDDAALFDLLTRWVPDAGTRQRVLVDNPAALYGFS